VQTNNLNSAVTRPPHRHPHRRHNTPWSSSRETVNTGWPSRSGACTPLPTAP